LWFRCLFQYDKASLEKDNDKNVLWINANGKKLPFRNNSFNSLYMTLVIHQIQNREEALRDIYRVLKINGRVVILTNSHARLKRHLLSHFPGVIKKDLERLPTISTIKKIMKSIGFLQIEYEPIEYNECISRDEFIDRVQNKYISTLTLFNEKEFQRRFKIFKNKILEKYGDEIIRHSGFDFVIGIK